MKKLRVEVRRISTRKREVWIVSGVQSFRLDYHGASKAECLWYAQMLRIALGIERKN